MHISSTEVGMAIMHKNQINKYEPEKSASEYKQPHLIKTGATPQSYIPEILEDN